MTAGDREQDLKEFYQSLSGRRAEPLEPDSPLYVPILQAEPGKDPILALHQALSWAEVESVSLLTGFRGNGGTRPDCWPDRRHHPGLASRHLTLRSS